MPGDQKSRDTRSATQSSQPQRSNTAAESRTQSMERREQSRGSRDWQDPWANWTLSPFSRSWSDQMERFFGNFGLGAAGSRPELSLFNPQLETFQRGDELVIRADLPGLSKEDVDIEVSDDMVIIRGERRHETVEDREGFYRSERSYGSFSRAVPLPEGAITEKASATFKDGVLEITMPAPPSTTRRGRRIEISEGSSTRGGASQS